MIIRKAINEDIPWFIESLAEDMFSLLGEKTFMNKEYLPILLESIILNGVCLVAEKEDKIIGSIAGVVHPSLYNPNILFLSELFWWVDQQYRLSSAGAKLLLLFESYAKEYNAEYINMTVMPNTNLNTDALIKRGYKIKETAFVRRV